MKRYQLSVCTVLSIDAYCVKGTEAVAVTLYTKRRGCAKDRQRIEIKVDRPFLYFIVNRYSNTVLFQERDANWHSLEVA